MSEAAKTTTGAPGACPPEVRPFSGMLEKSGLRLTRAETEVLQINAGLTCNQACAHCHLDAGPHRRESMSRETVDSLIECAGCLKFKAIDITGGAPELNPNLPYMIESLAPVSPELIVRSNLTLLAGDGFSHLLDLFSAHSVVLATSLPSINRNQTESQRGRETFDKIIQGLKKLNAAGYGQPGSGLKLNLVSNPTGAFTPLAQDHAEKRFRQELSRRWGIVFTNLFTFTNVPLGRFQRWLEQSGNYGKYIQKLASGFNPCTIEGLMCRGLISVSWDGYLYDCDFNQAANLFMGGKKTHISSLQSFPEPGSPIATGDHCYACTVGPGFT